MRLVALDFYRMCREETRETQTYDLILPLQSDDADDRSWQDWEQTAVAGGDPGRPEQ